MLEQTLYNPANQSKDSLIGNFVVRTKVFEEIFNDINSSNMDLPEAHYLVQGQRGMGKTTLLLRLKYEVESSGSLKEWLLPVFFNEESYDLTSLSAFWEKLLKYLDEYWDNGGEYYGHTEVFVDQEDYERKCFDYLMEVLISKKKKLIIFFDNFTQLFIENLKDREKKRLEEILSACNMIRIIAASAIVIAGAKNQSEPLFRYFKVVPLLGLSKEETLGLLMRLSVKGDVKIDFDKNKGKLETLAVLTGGVIRTLMLVYEVILADQDGSALTDLQLVLDRVTPLYKHRIEDLPVQQRRIIDVVAKQWDAMSTKDIAVHLRDDGKPISTKLISAQLQQLEKNNVIDKKETSTKNNLYQLKERFFNIWYLMRHGDRKDRRKVIWLTRFLELWYEDEKGFDEFLKRHLVLLKSGKYHAKSAILLTEALASSSHLDIQRLNKLYAATSAILTEEQRKQLPDLSDKQLMGAIKLFTNKDYEGAINLLANMDHKDVTRDLLMAWNYYSMGEHDKAFALVDGLDITEVTDIVMLSTFYVMAKDDARALEGINRLDHTTGGWLAKLKGDFYVALGENDKAKKMYEFGAEKKDSGSVAALVDIYIMKDEYELAEMYLLKGIEFQKEFYKPLLDIYIIKNNTEDNKLKAIKILDELQVDMQKDPELLVYKGLSRIFCNNEDEEYLGADFDEMQIFDQARKLFVKEEVKDYEYYLMYYFLLMIFTTIRFNKKKAIKIISEIEDLDRNSYFKLKHAFVLVWNDDYTLAVDIFIRNIKAFKPEDSFDQRLMSEVIMLLIARKRYSDVTKIFDSFENLKDIIKPLYFAFLEEMDEKDSNEYLKMGRELEQPVKDVIAEIGEMAKRYK